MRDRYYRVLSAEDVPPMVALVHIWRQEGLALARLDEDDERVEAAPDLILFRAALARHRQDLLAIFVQVESLDLWQPEWGDLVDYRGSLHHGKAGAAGHAGAGFRN